MGISFSGFRRFVEEGEMPSPKKPGEDDKVKWDTGNAEDLEFDIPPGARRDVPVMGGMQMGKDIFGGPSGYSVKFDGDNVVLTPLQVTNKVFKRPGDSLYKRPDPVGKDPIVMSREQYFKLMNRGQDQAAAAAGGGMGGPPMPGM
jgi:hypothetical protein